jgi:anti-sigma regulatory factor (Ser/Thr protein kinase)
LVTYRTLVRTYPTADGNEAALVRLADLYEDIKRYELAADTLRDLARRVPNNTRDAAWRAERRNETVIHVIQEGDVVVARNAGKDICRDLGFSEVAVVKAVTAISEVARNIIKYAGKGQISLRRLLRERHGIEIIATDQGPGIANIDLVLSPKYHSPSGMGVGLRGTRRLMDHFEITSHVGSGTTVILRKYKD